MHQNSVDKTLNKSACSKWQYSLICYHGILQHLTAHNPQANLTKKILLLYYVMPVLTVCCKFLECEVKSSLCYNILISHASYGMIFFKKYVLFSLYINQNHVLETLCLMPIPIAISSDFNWYTGSAFHQIPQS